MPAATLPWVLALMAGLWVDQRRTRRRRECARRAGWAVDGRALVRAGPRSAALARLTATEASTLHFLDVGQGDAAAIRTPGGTLGAGGCRARRRGGGCRAASGGAVPAAAGGPVAGARGRLPRPRRSPRRPSVGDGAGSHRPRRRARRRRFRPAVYRVSRAPSDRRRAVAPGARRGAIHARRRPVHGAASRRPAGRTGARTSTRIRSCCWWSTATFRRCSPGTPDSPRSRRWRAGSAGWTCSRWGITGAAAARATLARRAGARRWRSSRSAETTTDTRRRATLERLRAHGVAVHRTDREGTITVVTDGRRMTVRSRGRPASYDVR